MSTHNYKIIKSEKVHWVWKHRPRLFSRLLLHRKNVCKIEDVPEKLLTKALKVNLLAFQVLLIDYSIGLVQLSDHAFTIPTTLVLGQGGSSIVKVALLFESQNNTRSVRRVAFRMPYFMDDFNSGYRPGSYGINETQKSLYDHPNIEPTALYLGDLRDPKIPYPLEFTVEEIWENAHTFNIYHRSERQAIDVLEVILGIAKALEYLHSFNLIHRDIKPWNVLVKRYDDGHLDVRVTDLETIRPETDRKIPVRGTPGFVAPEVAESVETIEGAKQGLQTKAADIYALGQSILYFRFILFQKAFANAHKYDERIHDMMYVKMRTTVDRKPISKKSFKTLMARLSKQGAFEGLEYFELILSTLEDIARKLCDKDPDKRPSAHEVVELLQSLADVTEFKAIKHMGESNG